MSVCTSESPTIRPPETDRRQPSRGGQPTAALAGAAAFCFVVAFVACLVQNLSRSSVDQSWSFDSSHYLNSAQQLFTIWQQLLDHGLREFNTGLLTPLAEDLLLDGPVMPLLGSMVLLCTNKSLTFAQATLFIGLQSFFGAGAAAVLCLAGARFTGSWRWGALAGVLWALYPPAVIGAGKFMTEIPGALLLICLVLVLSTTVEPGRQALVARAGLPLLAGFLTAGIWLLKAALAPASVLINLVALAQVGSLKGRALLSSALVAGLVTVLLPWLVFTKVASGHLQVMPQRVPVLNAVYGLEPDTDGWGSVAPKSPLQTIYSEQDGLLPVCIAMISAHPSESVNLILRKTTRLWEAPSNDYHRKFLRVFTPVVQGWWHDVLILGGLFGLLIFLLTAVSSQVITPTARFIGNSGAVAIGAHLIFSFFSTNTRYGFTAMPFFVLFAVYALARLYEKRISRQAAIAICCGGALVVALRLGLLQFVAAGSSDTTLILALELSAYTLLLTLAIFFTASTVKHLRPEHSLQPAGKVVLGAAWLCLLLPIVANQTSDRTIREWATTLRSGQSACRRIEFSERSEGIPSGGWAYVGFDGNEKSQTALVRVNGTAIADNPEPICASNRQGSVGDFQALFAKLLRAREETIRQWRVVAVPLSLLRRDLPNTLSLEPRTRQSITVYGDYPGRSQSATVPSLTYFSATKLCNATAPLDARPATILAGQITSDVSWLHDNAGDSRDLSGAPGTQFGRFRLFLLTGFARDKNASPTNEAPGHRIW